MKRNKIILPPESLLKAINEGVLVKDTMKYSSDRVGLIYLPGSDRLDLDKQVEMGEVISTGNDVGDEINVGDVVLYRRLTAYHIPNGLEPYKLWKLEYPYSILAVIPQGTPEIHEDIPAPVTTPVVIHPTFGTGRDTYEGMY